MKKTGYFFLFFILLISVIFGLRFNPILPRSTGSFSEVLFVVKDNLWETLKPSVDSTIGAPIIATTQKEPKYKIIQINHSEFKGLLKKHKNIVIINQNQNEGRQDNKWATQQLIMQLSLDSNNILKKMQKLEDILMAKEITNLKKEISKKSNKNAQNNIKNNFEIDVLVPKEYTVLINKNNFFWAEYNPTKKEEIKQLIIFSFTTEKSNSKNEVLEKVDSVFAKYLLGSPKDSYVKIEPKFSTYYKNNIYRGLWKLENGFMGGPFVIKTYFLEEKTVVAVGVIFAPQSKKRDHIKEIEAIL